MAIKLSALFLCISHFIFGQAWLQLPDFPGTERDDGVGVTVNNKAYFGTGLQIGYSRTLDFYTLDLTTLTWSPIAAMPAGTQRQYASAFRGPGCFYVVAGDGNNGNATDMYRYDIATDTWFGSAPKPGNALMGMSCFELGDKVIFVGGKFQNGSASDEVWEYSISANAWTQKNNFPFGGRWRASGTALNGIGYLLFGVDNAGHLRKELYAYNHAADTWTKVNDFPLPGRAYAALQNTNSTLTMFGGLDSLNVYHDDVWQYNPATGSWTQHQSLPAPGRKGGMSVASGNRFYYTCGITTVDRIKQTWMLDVPVGLKENNAAISFLMFPNPAQDFLYLKFESNADLDTVVLTDLSGREIKKQQAGMQTEMQVGLNGLENGIYFLKVSGKNNAVEVRKILKN